MNSLQYSLFEINSCNDLKTVIDIFTTEEVLFQEIVFKRNNVCFVKTVSLYIYVNLW